MILEIENLTKKYGSLTAIEDISLRVAEGEILALAGPDGAGKTSLFRSICGLIQFDAGRVTIAGRDVKTQFDRIKPLLGYMPQNFSLYPDLSVKENLYFYAGLFGLNRTGFKAKIKPLYEFSGLGPFAGRRAAHLSGGMKQKLALSCALIHDPRVLILDEPTTGVDPLSRRQFWKILRSLCQGGSAILVSTPYMDEVALSDRAIFMHQAKKLTEGTPDEIVGQYIGKVYRVDLEPTTAQLGELDGIDGIMARRFGAGVHIYTDDSVSFEQLLTKLGRVGIQPEKIETIPAELEDSFIQMMGTA